MAPEQVAAFCRRWGVVELAVFGSAASGEWNAQSDVDLLVRFAPDARRTLGGYVQMREELEAMLKRPVDLLSRDMVEKSRNRYRREAILAGATVLYAA